MEYTLTAGLGTLNRVETESPREALEKGEARLREILTQCPTAEYPRLVTVTDEQNGTETVFGL